MGSRCVAVAVDELERDLGKFVRVEDSEGDGCASGVDNSDADLCDAFKACGLEPIKECSGNSLPQGNTSPPDTADKVEDGEEPETALQYLFSVETRHCASSSSLVSALKGSREKLGAAPRKLSVTWAPDVYDPIPNSLSHTVKGRQKKSSRKDKDKDNNGYGKKNKKGQRGGKDKKQLRKHGGRSDRAQRSIDVVDRFVHLSNDLGDFDVGSPDYCGSSFLRESQTKFHFSVAEAS